MTYKLSQIIQEIGLDFSGNDHDITGLHTLRDASPSQLSFLHSEKYIRDLPDTQAAAVIMRSKYLPLLPEGTTAILTEEPYLYMALASRFFCYHPSIEAGRPIQGEACEIADDVSFARGVVIGDNVTIMSGCVIGEGCKIGSGTVLYPNVTLYHDTQIGNDCIIHAGVVIGADGYGFVQNSHGTHIKIYQNGNVIIGGRVEIGANSTIDRATFGSTIVGSGTKIDNLVQIAHNCKIGKNCLLVCQTALAGSTILGDSVTMGGQSGATGHLEIGSHATIASRAGVTKSLVGAKVYGGFPAIEHKLWLKREAKLQRLLKKG